MQLAPGGHLGRFIIWTRSAFDRLDEVFGEQPDTESLFIQTGMHFACKGCFPQLNGVNLFLCWYADALRRRGYGALHLCLLHHQENGGRCRHQECFDARMIAHIWSVATALQASRVPSCTNKRSQVKAHTWPVATGTAEVESTQKRGYKLPRNIMANADLTRLINSDEVQTIVRPPKVSRMVVPLKKNPLKNLGALLKLNPYAKAARRTELLAQVRQRGPPSTPPPSPCFACWASLGAPRSDVGEGQMVHMNTIPPARVSRELVLDELLAC